MTHKSSFQKLSNIIFSMINIKGWFKQMQEIEQI